MHRRGRGQRKDLGGAEAAVPAAASIRRRRMRIVQVMTGGLGRAAPGWAALDSLAGTDADRQQHERQKDRDGDTSPDHLDLHEGQRGVYWSSSKMQVGGRPPALRRARTQPLPAGIWRSQRLRASPCASRVEPATAQSGTRAHAFRLDSRGPIRDNPDRSCRWSHVRSRSQGGDAGRAGRLPGRRGGRAPLPGR